MTSLYGIPAGQNMSHILNLSLPGNTTCIDANSTNSSTCFSADATEATRRDATAVEILVIIFLSSFILAILVGNTMVILSVALFREMRTLTNGLIVSLATADILVAIIVLPISLHQEIMREWTLGPIVCDFWITSDVFCCTASILNIVVIAIDRYWLITKNVRYTHSTTLSRQRVCVVMLTLAWLASAVISSLPLLGWRTGTEKATPNLCIISQDLGYTVFSTFGAFWFPLSLILAVYYKIFKVARQRARSRTKQRTVHPSMNSTAFTEMNGHKTAILRGPEPTRASDSGTPPPGSPRALPSQGANNNDYQASSNDALNTEPTQPSPPAAMQPASTAVRKQRRFRIPRAQRSRTRSSARTLGLIIGGFIFCWLPFFIPATLVPLWPSMTVPDICMSIVLWLGYSNSLLNPAIYAIWDKNFRRSFKRLSTCDIRWSNIL